MAEQGFVLFNRYTTVVPFVNDRVADLRVPSYMIKIVRFNGSTVTIGLEVNMETSVIRRATDANVKFLEKSYDNYGDMKLAFKSSYWVYQPVEQIQPGAAFVKCDTRYVHLTTFHITNAFAANDAVRLLEIYIRLQKQNPPEWFIKQDLERSAPRIKNIMSLEHVLNIDN